jgi:hypothetical protein
MPAPVGSTLLELVNSVAQSVGHPTTEDVAGSQDEAIRRLMFYSNMCGNELVYMYNWDFLSKSGEIMVAADSADQREKAFDLPVDFKCMTDDTQWNRSTQLPAVGPINAQDWQWLVVRNAQITTRMMWRIRQGKLWIKSPTIDPQPFTFEYLSKNWAVNGDSELPQDVMKANNDYHIFPPYLMILFTRFKWFENEGYDASASQRDFNKAFQWFTGTDKGASSISLVPGTGYPYINAARNIPDTGYGSAY